MKSSYWDSLASSFDDDVFDPVAEDIHSILHKLILDFSADYSDLIDIGCGNGRNIQRFAHKFKRIVGLDISGDCIEMARRGPGKLNNVRLECHDLLLPFPVDKKFKLGLCLNVLLDPGFTRRQLLFRNILQLVKPGGRLIFLVPSLESVLLTANRHIWLNLRDNPRYREAAAATNPELGFTTSSIRDGLVKKGGTLTKHYLKEELELLFREHKQTVHSIEKIEYAWSTEFEDPPASMNAPYPWDWLVIASPAC